MCHKLVSIVIVNYDGLRFLPDCLSSLRDQEYEPVEIIFVDNGSRDASVRFVQRFFPKATVIENGRNMGFATGNNIGIRASSGRYILLLNNDTRVSPKFLNALVNYMELRPEVGAAQSKLLLMSDPSMVDSVGSFLTPKGFLYHEGHVQMDGPQYSLPKEIFSAKGACLLMRRSVLEQVGLFDDDFFLYFEETDLCWRIWLAGYSVAYVPGSVVFHEVGGTSKELPAPFVDYHSFKNRICSLVKNLELHSLFRIMPMHLLLCIGVAAAYAIKGRPGNSLAIGHAVGWNLRNLGGTYRKRRRIQAQRRVSDRELWPRIARDRPWLEFYRFLNRYVRKPRA